MVDYSKIRMRRPTDAEIEAIKEERARTGRQIVRVPASPDESIPKLEAKFICELPPGGRLHAVGARILLIAPNVRPQWVTPGGLVPVDMGEEQ